MVVLDEKKRASGSLYVDDGRSFAYQRGAFTKPRFTFEDNVLSSKVNILHRRSEQLQTASGQESPEKGVQTKARLL